MYMYKIMYMYVYSKKSCNLKMVKTFIQYIKKHKYIVRKFGWFHLTECCVKRVTYPLE